MKIQPMDVSMGRKGFIHGKKRIYPWEEKDVSMGEKSVNPWCV